MKRMIRNTLLLCICMLTAALTACQATPDAPIVVQKDMEQMIERGAKPQDSPIAGTLRERLNVPERLMLNEEAGKLSIVADVPLEIPKASGMPMMHVEAGKFSQEQVYTFFNTLCADKPMYLEPEQMDKPQIEQAILNIMAEKAAQGGSGKFWDNEIARLEEMHKTAPDKNVLIASDGTLLQNEVISDDSSDNSVIGINTILHASSDPGNGDAMRFIVYNDADYKTTDVSVYVDEHGNIHTLMQALGLNDFIVDRIMLFSDAERLAYEAEPIPDTNSTIPPVDNKKADEKYAYVFNLIRTVQGFPVASTFGISQASVEEMGFGKEWDYEYLTIAIDDAGIVNLRWNAPLVVTDTITENANLLPWAEIEATLLKMLSVKYTPLEGITSYKIELTRARLSLQRVMERDNFTAGLLIPVWNFYGSAVASYASGAAYDHAPNDGGPLLSINAIDGSIIDVKLGY